jgi:magnesium chelatase family protein
MNDYKDIFGYINAKSLLELAAAGRHNVLLVSAPGGLATALASRLPGILPTLTAKQTNEVGFIHTRSEDKYILTDEPSFIAPHHTSTQPALTGWKTDDGEAKYGSLSKAHNGVLFLEEATLFTPKVLKVLETTVKNKSVTIVDKIYPSDFQLVLATSPCPCGQRLDERKSCTCTGRLISKYFGQIPDGIRNRIDMIIEIQKKDKAIFCDEIPNQRSSEEKRKHVIKLRRLIAEYLDGTPWRCSSEIPGVWLRKKVQEISAYTLEYLDETAYDKGISLRGSDNILRVAFTLAMMRRKDLPNVTDISDILSLYTADNETQRRFYV